MSCAEMAELIEMMLCLWTRVGPVSHVFGGGQDPPGEEAVLRAPHAMVISSKFLLEIGTHLPFL